MKRPSWNELQAVKTIAEQRSFRRAAEVLGLKRSSLSHTIKGLEATLGVRLFHRTTRSVALTEAGEMLIARLTPLLAEMDELLNDVTASGHQPYGTLRISASDAAIRLLLEKVLPTFIQQKPGIEIDLVAQGQLVDIVALGFDAGIRLIEDVPKDMVAIPLSGPLRFVTVASPDYLAWRPKIQHPQDMMQHICLRQRLPGGKRYHWEYQQHEQQLALDVPGSLTLDSSALMVEAAVAGLGIAYVPELYAQPWLASQQLVTLLDDWAIASQGIALYFPQNRHMPVALRLFVDAVKAAPRV
ncbi:MULTISPECIES: LysR family transcriptional regulator [Enterobacteriaceae]|jgi:DNA-binding transcriptional LysR family regulator|uniref:LysR family transcriptional regulator n=1 Tax=Enterobacteriaceae TaxID=543 RepID=UPI0011A0176A|nr:MULTISPECIES: LysR family transcriptional regulator [Enterobacteriaceae]MCR4456815.1 LysR family transcriptional regulator [Pseudescherichia sp. L3]MDF2779702.1 LysR family transcriptional regulator [Enterobacteriaceae bacterium]